MANSPKIKECFYLGKNGACCSQEIYRKLPAEMNMDTGKLCPFSPELTAIYNDGTSYALSLRCPEFTPKREEAS